MLTTRTWMKRMDRDSRAQKTQWFRTTSFSIWSWNLSKLDWRINAPAWTHQRSIKQSPRSQQHQRHSQRRRFLSRTTQTSPSRPRKSPSFQWLCVQVLRCRQMMHSLVWFKRSSRDGLTSKGVASRTQSKTNSHHLKLPTREVVWWRRLMIARCHTWCASGLSKVSWFFYFGC